VGNSAAAAAVAVVVVPIAREGPLVAMLWSILARFAPPPEDPLPLPPQLLLPLLLLLVLWLSLSWLVEVLLLVLLVAVVLVLLPLLPRDDLCGVVRLIVMLGKRPCSLSATCCAALSPRLPPSSFPFAGSQYMPWMVSLQQPVGEKKVNK